MQRGHGDFEISKNTLKSPEEEWGFAVTCNFSENRFLLLVWKTSEEDKFINKFNNVFGLSHKDLS